MNTIELLEQLLEKPQSEIEYALLALLLKGKIDFLTINSMYVKSLEAINEDQKLKLSDANSCTCALLTHFKSDNKSNHTDIHWALHNLNESRQFQMRYFNEKFGYDKENDCKYSYYWRNKNNK